MIIPEIIASRRPDGSLKVHLEDGILRLYDNTGTKSLNIKVVALAADPFELTFQTPALPPLGLGAIWTVDDEGNVNFISPDKYIPDVATATLNPIFDNLEVASKINALKDAVNDILAELRQRHILQNQNIVLTPSPASFVLSATGPITITSIAPASMKLSTESNLPLIASLVFRTIDPTVIIG